VNALLLTCGSVALPDSPYCDIQTTNPIGFTGIIRRANVSHFVGTAVSSICLRPTDYRRLVLITRTWLRPITATGTRNHTAVYPSLLFLLMQGVNSATSATGRSVQKTLITNKCAKSFFIKCNTLLQVSTLRGHRQGEIFYRYTKVALYSWVRMYSAT
jgi:hypothetical protein